MPSKNTEHIDELSAQDKVPRGSQATQLIELCNSIELFHTPDKESFVTFPVDNHFETWPMKAPGFKRWLARQYYITHAKAVNSKSIQDALITLDGKAQYEGAEIPVFLRLGKANGKMYVDMTNKEWEIIEIDSSGWRITKEAPLKFRRSKGMLPLPTPISVAGVEGVVELRRFINVETEGDLKLVVAWMINALNPDGPYLILVLYGEHGTAKSTMVKVLRTFNDPNKAPLRRVPKNTDDLMVMAKHNWNVVIDNMSFLPDWLSDDLCCLATGGALSKREHFSNDDEIVLDAKRPIILNGIDEFVVRGDLASRSITLNLPVISETERKKERILWENFEKAKGKIFGALLSALSESLRLQHSFDLGENLRMADAFHWASGAETSFGWERGSIVSAFKTNLIEANEVALNSSLIYPYLKELAICGWRGTPTALLDCLNKMRGDSHSHEQKNWPTNPRNLTDRIRRINPNLRKSGIEVEFSKTSGSDSERILDIHKYRNYNDASVASDANKRGNDKYAGDERASIRSEGGV